MKIITKYGTFLIIPFVLAGMILTLCTLKVKEKAAVTLVCLSKESGIVYIPQETNIPIAKGERMRLETSHSVYIEGLITDVAKEPANIRVQIHLDSIEGLNGNSICNAYIITSEAIMLDSVFRKILRL